MMIIVACMLVYHAVGAQEGTKADTNHYMDLVLSGPLTRYIHAHKMGATPLEPFSFVVKKAILRTVDLTANYTEGLLLGLADHAAFERDGDCSAPLSAPKYTIMGCFLAVTGLRVMYRGSMLGEVPDKVPTLIRAHGYPSSIQVYVSVSFPPGGTPFLKDLVAMPFNLTVKYSRAILLGPRKKEEYMSKVYDNIVSQVQSVMDGPFESAVASSVKEIKSLVG